MSMMAVVAAKGYAGASVADVVDRAGVSRRTFYEQFPDKETCFLAAYDTGVEVMLGRIGSALAALGDAPWERRAEVSIATYLDVLSGEADWAWCSHVEILGAGRAPLARRAEILGLFAGLWRGLHGLARETEPSGVRPLPPEVWPALIGGQEEMVREHLRASGAASAGDLAGPLWRVVEVLFRG